MGQIATLLVKKIVSSAFLSDIYAFQQRKNFINSNNEHLS